MTTEQKRMEVFILLDRTGSMADLWEEAITSVNAYVHELKMDGAQDRITVAVFDAYEEGMQFDVLRNTVEIGEWKDVGVEEVLPRGMTPLLDALMRIITMAEEANNDKTAIVVMTDGHENASTEVSKEDARAALDRVKKKNWQLNFLGANFDGFDQAAGLGVAHSASLNFCLGHAEKAMLSTAQIHSRYRKSTDAITYSEEDRNNSGEDEVK